MKRGTLLILSLLGFGVTGSARGIDTAHASASTPEARVKQPDEPSSAINQLIVVTTETWSTHKGTLRTFESTQKGSWKEVGTSTSVSLGRFGLAWGRGLLEPTDEHPLKKEGDGRSPAGIFSLGTAFGAAESLPEDSKGYPYLKAKGSSYCVEDSRSPNYNRLIELGEEEARVWRQRSPLARADGLFQWAVVVEQNQSPITPGAGSCIFLHVWRGAHVGTSGCTAMPLSAVSRLVSWLDPRSETRLVQLPRAVYEQIQDQRDLPRL
jgi:D-alanyl-D-alanine dipeptidase